MRLAIFFDQPSVSAIVWSWPYRSPKPLRLSPPSCPTFVRAMFNTPSTARWADVAPLIKKGQP